MVLRSSLYQDIYFSPEDGVAESEYVYIKGNRLPERFRAIGCRPFVVGELGFGTGLNFLLTVRAFLENAPSQALLHYYSIEKHPLPVADIHDALAPLVPGDLQKKLVQVLRASSWTLRGFHTIFFHERIRLTLLTGDVEETLRSLSGGTVDAWYADGFSPAKNPAMWTDKVFAHLARLSRPGTTLSTFSSAGFVRRNMEENGFSVQKIPGFGNKREMVVAHFSGSSSNCLAEGSPSRKGRHALIVGGGIAGLTTSLALLRRGWTVELFEKEKATGMAASGNPAGLFMPYLTAQPTVISRFTLRACETLISSFSAFGWDDLLYRTGIVRRIGGQSIDTDLEQRIEKARISHELPASFLRRVDEKSYFMRKAGWTRPAALCKRITDRLLNYGESFRLTLQRQCDHLPASDVVVVASGAALASFKETAFLPVKAVRGQLFVCEAGQAEKYLQSDHVMAGGLPHRPVVFDSYVIPDREGWVFGATFEPYSVNPERDPASDERLLNQIAMEFPEIGIAMKEDGFMPSLGRVGFRPQSKDYVPVIGPLPDYEKALEILKSDRRAAVTAHTNIFVQGGFGSRGILSSMLAAEILAAHMNEEVYPVESDLVEALLPHRFVRRAARSYQ
jgi:tRNA 5-methylaminomethyl-2-thiouridine biosynthesis bifunctional protein